MPTRVLTTGLLCLLMVFGAGGCIVTSLHPFYEQSQLTPAPELLGTWLQQDGEEVWTFTAEPERGYRLRLIDEDGLRALFEVYPFMLGDQLFLDVFPVSDQTPGSSPYRELHTVQVHGVLRVYSTKPSLDVAALDYGWLDRQIKKAPDSLAHERIASKRIVLTADSGALQAFLREHLATDDAYGERMTLLPATGAWSGSRQRAKKKNPFSLDPTP